MTQKNFEPYKKNNSLNLSNLLDIALPIRKNAREFEEENEKLKAFISTLPVEYCGWDKNGAQAISSGLCYLLNVDKITKFADLQNAVTPADAASLETLFSRLQQYDENFEINITAVNNNKILKAFGKNGILDNGDNKISVIWLYDISEFASSASNLINTLHDSEIRESEMRAALNSMPFPIWLRNINLDIIWSNKNYCNIVEKSNASVIAEQKELNIIDSDKKPINLKSLAKQALLKGETAESKGRILIEGKRNFLNIKEIPLKSENIIIGLGLDITKEEDLQNAQKQLIRSYHDAMEQLSTAIAMYDADTKLEFYNSAYEHATGISASWLNNKPRLVDVVDKLRELRKIPEQIDYKQYKQSQLKLFTSLEPLEETQYLPDGTVIRLIAVPRPMGGIMVTMEDVTSHMQLETSYNTLMEVQKETMNNLAEGIAVFGEDGRLKLYNHSFSNIWNIMPESLSDTPHISKIIESIKAPLQREKETEEIKQTIKRNALERDLRKGRAKTLDDKIIEYSVVPLPDGNILNAYTDITDTIKVEEALREKNEALHAAEKLKTNFIANVSYQLRTPLNTVMGFTEMLKQQYIGTLNEKQMSYMSNILEAGERLKSLINDILDLSSIEAGQMELSYSRINAKTLIENIVDITQTWGRKNNIEMIIDCKQDRLFFDGDEQRVKQILLNLISNAFNFSPSGSKVVIGAEEKDNYILISVKDNGIGIDENEIERVFTPFDKINSGTTTNRSGAGLGLTLVKNIVELHKGRIEIESKKDTGTSVLVFLPIKK